MGAAGREAFPGVIEGADGADGSFLEHCMLACLTVKTASGDDRRIGRQGCGATGRVWVYNMRSDTSQHPFLGAAGSSSSCTTVLGACSRGAPSNGLCIVNFLAGVRSKAWYTEAWYHCCLAEMHPKAWYHCTVVPPGHVIRDNGLGPIHARWRPLGVL